MLLSLVPANKRDPVGCFIAGRECMLHARATARATACVGIGIGTVVGGTVMILMHNGEGIKTVSSDSTPQRACVLGLAKAAGGGLFCGSPALAGGQL